MEEKSYMRSRFFTYQTKPSAGKAAARRPLATALTQGSGGGWLAIRKLNWNYISLMLNLISLTVVIVYMESAR